VEEVERSISCADLLLTAMATKMAKLNWLIP